MPNPSGYILTERDVKLLRELDYTFRRLQHYINPFRSEPEDKIEHEDIQHNSEIYIARTPPTGIPALASAGTTGIGDTPGSATCTIFKTKRATNLTDTLASGFTKVVLNLNTAVIPGDSWIFVVRDKHGQWYGIPVAAESSTSCTTGIAWLGGLKRTNCLRMTIESVSGDCDYIDDTQEFVLYWDTISECWTSPTLWQAVGTGTGTGEGECNVVFCKVDCLPQLTICGICLTYLGCSVDNGLLFSGGGEFLCPGTSGGCDDYFIVKLVCITCPEVPNQCCASDLPERIYITFSGGTGTAVCLAGTTLPLDIDLTPPPGTTVWQGFCLPIASCNTSDQTVLFTCDPSALTARVNMGIADASGNDCAPRNLANAFYGSGATNIANVNCDPLLVSFTVTLNDYLGNPAGTSTVTISGTPP